MAEYIASAIGGGVGVWTVFDPTAVTSTSSGSAPIIISGFLTASLLLSAAALSGGANLAAATGSQPQRIACVAETYITGATSVNRPGIAADPDGLRFWHVDSALGQLKRYRLSDGVIDRVVTGSTTDPTRNTLTTPQSLNPGFGNRLWFASQGLHSVGFIDVTTGTPICEMFSGSGLPSNPTHVCENRAGRILVRTGVSAAGTYQEFSYSGTGSANTVAYTGQQIIEGTTFWDAVTDMSGNLYTTNGTLTAKRDGTTLTASLTFTPSGGSFTTIPGYGAQYRALTYHPSAARLYTRQQVDDLWLSLPVATMVPDGKVFDGSEFGNPVGSVGATAVFHQQMAFTPDGARAVFNTYERETAATTLQHFRTLTLQPQRARWSWAPGANVHVKLISIPGMFGNLVGSISDMPAHTWLNGEYDLRKTKFFYSTDGGTNRTEFRESEFIDIAVTSGQTLTIDVEMQKTPRNNWGPAPYIGDKTSAGLGGCILYSVD